MRQQELPEIGSSGVVTNEGPGELMNTQSSPILAGEKQWQTADHRRTSQSQRVYMQMNVSLRAAHTS